MCARASDFLRTSWRPLPAAWRLGVILGPTASGKSRAIEELRADFEAKGDDGLLLDEFVEKMLLHLPREEHALVSGGASDGTVKLWDCRMLTHDAQAAKRGKKPGPPQQRMAPPAGPAVPARPGRHDASTARRLPTDASLLPRCPPPQR